MRILMNIFHDDSVWEFVLFRGCVKVWGRKTVKQIYS